MSQQTGQGAPPEQSGATHQPEVQWDLKDAATYTCDVANSTAGADDVVLNFGARQRGDAAPSEVAVRLLRRIKLPPMTARALRDMLRDVIADIDADKPREAS